MSDALVSMQSAMVEKLKHVAHFGEFDSVSLILSFLVPNLDTGKVQNIVSAEGHDTLRVTVPFEDKSTEQKATRKRAHSDLSTSEGSHESNEYLSLRDENSGDTAAARGSNPKRIK